MRTTITIDDGLLDRVRRQAVERGTTVSRVIEDSVREKLYRLEGHAAPRYAVAAFRGGRPHGRVDLDDNAALLEVMDAQ